MIEGHALVFDSRSEDLGFREVIAPGACRGALQRRNDQFLLWQHDSSQVLARRSAGTLELREDERGLFFRAELVNTSIGRDAAELVRTGHIDSMSFGFSMVDGKDEWSRVAGEDYRRITELGDILEVSIVSRAAYAATDAHTAAREAAERELVEVRGRPKAQKAPRISGDTRPPYGPHSSASYFRDLANVKLSDARAQANMSPGSVGRDPGGSLRPFPGRRGSNSGTVPQTSPGC